MDNIYIGYDSTNYGQELAYEICKRSLKKYNDKIKINKLSKQDLINSKYFYRNDNTGSTEFTYTRFLVPFLNNYKGWVLFCDSDFLWLCDPNEIFEKYADEKYAVCCVKHEYNECNGKTKMDGRTQEWYPRKNWSSLMLFNCEHPSIKNLNLDNINNETPKWLHRMEWCKDEEIGEIDKSYNYLVNYYDDEKFKALHYTDGGPWHPEYRNVQYGNLWLEYLNSIEEFKLFHKKSNILYVTTFNKKLYDNYAYRFIDSFDTEGDLLIYSEDDLSFLKDKIKDKFNYYIINSNKYIPEMVDFIKRNKERNKKDIKKKNGWGVLYFNGIKFCYKVFAVTHAGINFNNYDYIIWVDSDCVFKKKLTNKILNNFISTNSMINFLGRKKQYSECGILIFNLNHQYCKQYFKEMLRMYTSNDIYKLKEWHDSYVWDHVRIDFEKKYNIENNSMTGFSHNDHVLKRIKLYKFIDHLKGPQRKIKGNSGKSFF